jgi:hypothetical protein
MRGPHCYVQCVHEARCPLNDNHVLCRAARPQHHFPDLDVLRCTIATSRAN